MVPLASTSVLRGTRANIALTPKTQDEIVKTIGMDVKDATTAREYLTNGAYVLEDVEITLETLIR